MSKEQETKSWNVAGIFDNFEDADKLRNILKEKHEHVKIKRGFKVYRVKTWDSPPKKEKAAQEKKKFKKGENVKRAQKNDNKKVRAGREKS